VFAGCLLSGQFLTGIYSFAANDFVSVVATSGTLQSPSASVPEPSVALLICAMGGLILIWKRAGRVGVKQ
jgi:hypothetical protein